MRILVTGATGFVGRALCLRLERDHHQVVAWGRSPERARAVLAASVDLLALRKPQDGSDAELERELARCDAVIHLAGENVAGGRWSAARKRALVESRVDLTQRLVLAMSRANTPPRILISASAVGYYGDRKDELLDECSTAGEDFLARLCVDWERAAQAAESFGARVVCLRTGIVLGPEGGVLGKLCTPFRLGLGGRLGSGAQFFPWVSLDDLLEMYLRALNDERFRGAYNATSPEPVTNAEFTRALGRVLGRPTLLHVPKLALRAVLGEGASALLASQRAVPSRWIELGFGFMQPDIVAALRSILGSERGVLIEPAHDVPEHAYLRQRKPTHVLTQTTEITAPIEAVAEFFSKAENLGTLTPPGMEFAIQTPRPILMRQGTQIDYTIRLGILSLKWRSVIELWQGQAGFADAQHRGPYRCWWHEHSFERTGRGTRMQDRVYFSAPFGPLGRSMVRFLIAPKLRGIFGYRTFGIGWRFGVCGPTLATSATRSSSGTSVARLAAAPQVASSRQL